MKIVIEFIPVVVFFIVYLTQQDITQATLALMIATPVAIVLSYVFLRMVDKMLWITLGAVLFFGGLTLFFNDGIFIKIKPTIVNILLATACIGSYFVGSKKSLFEHLLGSKINLSAAQWRAVSAIWVMVFLTAATSNMIVLLYFSEAVWVHFRLFGLLGITLCGLIAQTVYLVRLSKTQSIFANQTPTKI